MSEDRKFCADCRFYKGSWDGRCGKWGHYDLVTGKFKPSYAENLRSFHGQCGTDGKTFEPKLTLRERLEIVLVASKLVLHVLAYLPRMLFNIAKTFINKRKEKSSAQQSDVLRVPSPDVRNAEEAKQVGHGIVPEAGDPH